MLTVADVYQYIDSLAPFETQLDFDNAGLLTGRMTQEVTGIHVALDCTAGVIQEAEKLGANLIVTHHPLMFHARKRITEEDDEGQLLCRLIRGKIALIAAHTNLDQAPGGINNVLANCCGLQRVSGEMFLRVGELDAPLTAAELRDQIAARLAHRCASYGAGKSNHPADRRFLRCGRRRLGRRKGAGRRGLPQRRDQAS